MWTLAGRDDEEAIAGDKSNYGEEGKKRVLHGKASCLGDIAWRKCQKDDLPELSASFQQYSMALAT